MPADDFMFVLSGDDTDGYAQVIQDLIASPIDLLFLESGETSAIKASFGSDLALMQNSNTDGDGIRGVYGYVNLAVTDHLREYWQPEWTVDSAGMPYTTRYDAPNQDADDPNPAGAPCWLINKLGDAVGPADNGAAGTQIYGPIVDFSDGATPAGPGCNTYQSWWDIVLGQIDTMYNAGWRDFFLDDVSRYAVNGVQGALDMVDLVNAVADRLDVLDGQANDTSIAINGGGYIMWDSGLTPTGPAIVSMFQSVDHLVVENLFEASPHFLVQIARNLSGTNTTLLSIEADTFLPAASAGNYFALADTLGMLTHVPADNDYAPDPVSGDLPGETYATAPTATHEIIVADVTNQNISGTVGADMIFATESADVVSALDGDNIVYGLGQDDLVTGGSGADVFYGGSGADTLEGGSGSDNLRGEAGADVLMGGAGNDVVNGGNDDDVLSGDDGNDLLFGGGGRDQLFGGAGSDRMFGGAANDIANGGADNDIINTGSGNDLIFGQTGNDLVFAQTGNDKVFGSDGNDKLFGGDGNDLINGGADDDQIFGGAGRDTITGATGDDVMSGGGSADTFVLAAGQGQDRITVFSGTDVIDITAFGLSNGGLTDQDWRDATTSVVTSGGGTNVTINWDGGGALVIENTGITGLTDADFLF